MPQKLNFGSQPADLTKSNLIKQLKLHNKIIAEDKNLGLFKPGAITNPELAKKLEARVKMLHGEDKKNGQHLHAWEALGTIVSRYLEAATPVLSAGSSESSVETQQAPDADATKEAWNAVARLRVIHTDLMEKYDADPKFMNDLTISTQNVTKRAFEIWLDGYQDELELDKLKSGEVFQDDQSVDSAVTSLIMALDNMPEEEIRPLLDYGDQGATEALFCGLIVRMITDPNLHSKTAEELPLQYRGMNRRVAERLLEILPERCAKTLREEFYDSFRDPQGQTKGIYPYISDILKSQTGVDADGIELQEALELINDNGEIFVLAPPYKQEPEERFDRIVTLLEVIHDQPEKLSTQNVDELLDTDESILEDVLKTVSSGKKKGLLPVPANISSLQHPEKFKEFLGKLRKSVEAAYNIPGGHELLLEALKKVEVKQPHNQAELEDFQDVISREIKQAHLKSTKDYLINSLGEKNGADNLIELAECMTRKKNEGRILHFKKNYPDFAQELDNPHTENLRRLCHVLENSLKSKEFPSKDRSLQRFNKNAMEALSMAARYYAENTDPESKRFSSSLIRMHTEAAQQMQQQIQNYPELLTPDLAHKYGIISNEVLFVTADPLYRILEHCTAASYKPTSEEFIKKWQENLRLTRQDFPELLQDGPLMNAHTLRKVSQIKNVELILLDIGRALNSDKNTELQKQNLIVSLINIYEFAKKPIDARGSQPESLQIISQAIERFFPDILVRRGEIMEASKYSKTEAFRKMAYKKAEVIEEKKEAKEKALEEKEAKLKRVTFADPVATEKSLTLSTQKEPDPQAKPKETQVEKKVITTTTTPSSTADKTVTTTTPSSTADKTVTTTTPSSTADKTVTTTTPSSTADKTVTTTTPSSTADKTVTTTTPSSTADKTVTTTTPSSTADKTVTPAVKEKQPWYKRYQSTIGYFTLFVLALAVTPLICTLFIPLAATATFWAVAITGVALGLVGLVGAMYNGYNTWKEEKIKETLQQALPKQVQKQVGGQATEKATQAENTAQQSPNTDVSHTSSVAQIAQQQQQEVAAA